jgi:molybdopterin molybdotransferase
MEFLTAVTPGEALGIIKSFPLPKRKRLRVRIDEALGRVLAEEVVASDDIPPFARSLVDGFAVRVKDIYGARETTPALLVAKGEVRVGQQTTLKVGPGEAVYVATGAMLPEEADGVVMQEQTRRTTHDIEVTKPVHKGENICFQGEDIKRGTRVLAPGKRVSAFDTGVLAALGIDEVAVYALPEIALISSGDEIVPIDVLPPLGKVRDINRYTVSNLLVSAGCSVHFIGIAADRLDDISAKLQEARGFDLIILSGGSSKGESDFVTAALETLGGELLFHGINVRPGKPTIFGRLWDKPVFGLPGHPVSCSLIMLRFVLPMLTALKGETDPRQQTVRGKLGANVPSSYGIEEYVRVKLGFVEGNCVVAPLYAKSSVISMLAKADGYIIVPEGSEGLEAGEEVEVYTFG